MIEIIQGTPGSGKSAVALLMGLLHLKYGGVFACNFDLVPDWADKFARQNWKVLAGIKDHYKVAMEYWSRCFKVGNTATLYELSKQLPDLVTRKYKNKREGKGLLIIDEAQLYFNSRSWKDNMSFIEFFTQHRKLGWNVILVAHYIEMIDSQIRPLIEIESRFRNLKYVRIPLIGLPLSPFNIFAVARFYSGLGMGKGMMHSRDLFILDKLSANLYDSLQVFAFNQLSDKIEHQGIEPEPGKYPNTGFFSFLHPKPAKIEKRQFNVKASEVPYRDVFRASGALCSPWPRS